MKTINIFIVLLVVYSMVACAPDLDLTPLNEKTTVTFYKTEADARTALNSVYSTLQNMYGSQYTSEVILTPTAAASDEGIPFLQGNADRVALWNYKFISANSFTAGVWGISY